MNEHNIQRLVVAWFRDRFPDLAPVFFAIPSGGKRDKVTAARLKAEGALPGVPDLMLAVPCGGKAGLFLELKTATGHPSKAQRERQAALKAQGYAVEVAKGYEAAKDVIANYLVQDLSPDLFSVQGGGHAL